MPSRWRCCLSYSWCLQSWTRKPNQDPNYWHFLSLKHSGAHGWRKGLNCWHLAVNIHTTDTSWQTIQCKQTYYFIKDLDGLSQSEYLAFQHHTSDQNKTYWAFILPVISSAVWAGQAFTSGSKWSMRNALLQVCYNGPAHVPSKVLFPWGIWFPISKCGSFGSHKSAPQTASRLIQPFLHSSPVCPAHTHTHTDRQTYRPCYMWHL